MHIGSLQSHHVGILLSGRGRLHRERVEFLESSIGDNADKHGKDDSAVCALLQQHLAATTMPCQALAELKTSHQKLMTDAKTKETAHSSCPVQNILFVGQNDMNGSLGPIFVFAMRRDACKSTGSEV